jgi:hypothetical protein
LAARLAAATDDPAREIAGAVPEAVDVKVRVPEELPADVGANTTLKVELAPAANESGRLSPFRLKPGPLTVACETEIALPPVFDTVTVCF